MEQTILATTTIFERGLTALRGRVRTLNKRAKRHGMVELRLRVVLTESVKREVRPGMFVPDTAYTVEINGREPCIDGWRLAARVEFNGIVGQVVHIAPGRIDDGSYKQYRTIAPICEHCGTKRRRNDVFVLEDSAGCRKIVARNCLADYLRDGTAGDLAVWAEFADALRCIESDGGEGEFDYRGENGNPAMPIGSYLQTVAMVKRTFGWLGRTAAKDSFERVATADITGRVLYGRGAGHDRWIEENNLHVVDGDSDYADKAIAWAAALDCTDNNEYLYTIGQIARAGFVDMRKLDGYAASILIAYDRACEREVEYAERAKGAKNKVWFGSKDKKEKGVRVTCKGLHSFEGHYGVTTIVRFEHYPNDTDKAILVWFASGDRYNEWAVDDEYTIDATVKEHTDDDKYGKQTKVNRVRA